LKKRPPIDFEQERKVPSHFPGTRKKEEGSHRVRKFLDNSEKKDCRAGRVGEKGGGEGAFAVMVKKRRKDRCPPLGKKNETTTTTLGTRNTRPGPTPEGGGGGKGNPWTSNLGKGRRKGRHHLRPSRREKGNLVPSKMDLKKGAAGMLLQKGKGHRM